MIRVEALGGLRIHVNGEESVPLAKQRLKSALLVYLSVERSCLREALIGTFWPEREPERARHVLSQTVYELRKMLGEEWLTIAGDRLTVSDQVTADVVEFTEAVEHGELEKALLTFHGGFLDGTYLAETKEFEEWCDRRNQRVTKLLRRALRETCELPDVPTWIDVAIDVARKSAERDLTDDEIQHALIQLLVRAGRRTDAIRQFEKYEAALAEDELEPLEHTRALMATIRDATESVDPVAVTPYAQPAPATLATLPRPTAPPAPIPTKRDPVAERAAARKRRNAIAGGAMVVALAVVMPFVIGKGGNDGGTDAKASASGPRIAVRPFEDLSPPGEDLEYFAAGMTEGLIDALGRVRGLEVRSKSAVRYWHALKLSPDSLSRVLDVDYLVDGSVARSGNALHVNVEVTGPRGSVFRTDTVHSWGDYLQMRDTLVEDVAILLRRAMGHELEMRDRRAETRNMRAWEHYQRAKQIHEDFVAFMLANGVDEADRALNRADSLATLAGREDPRWIGPPVLRGKLAGQRVQVVLFRGGGNPRPAIRSALNSAIQHATRAASIDKTAPEVYELRGVMRYRLRQTRAIEDTIEQKKNDQATEHDLLEAISLDSTRAEAWSTLSELYLVESRFVAARRAAQRAYESDRYYSGANDNLYRLAVSAFETNDDREAAKWCAEGRRRFPQHPQFVYCQLMLLAWSDTIRANVDSAWSLVRLSPALLAQAPGEDTEAMFKLMTASVIARANLPDSARNVMTRTLAATKPSASLLWVEAAARARTRDFGRADSLVSSYNNAIGFPRSFVLDTRALKPLRQEHVNTAPR